MRGQWTSIQRLVLEKNGLSFLQAAEVKHAFKTRDIYGIPLKPLIMTAKFLSNRIHECSHAFMNANQSQYHVYLLEGGVFLSCYGKKKQTTELFS